MALYHPLIALYAAIACSHGILLQEHRSHMASKQQNKGTYRYCHLVSIAMRQRPLLVDNQDNNKLAAVFTLYMQQ